MASRKRWQDIARERKLKQENSIPQEWRINLPPTEVQNVMDVPRTCGRLNEHELVITEERDVEVILKHISSRKWTSLDVTTAFLKRAIIAHQLTNCLTEMFIEDALARARSLDDHLSKTGETVGPLHGLPVSLKDQFCVAGYETVMGYVSWIGRIAEKNSVIVDMLIEAGAIPIVRTNVPQTLMWGETYNHVFGRTTNPYNRSLTCGGSSGGEGALIALRGCPLGVGTDIGGSIRIPAHMCGIYALRPSYNRLPYQGALSSMAGQESVTSVLGPMSGSLSGLKIFTKAILQNRPWDRDPLVPRLPWNEAAYELSEHGESKLCFGVLTHDGHTLPHPPILRALSIVRTALEKAGHQVLDWEPYKHQQIFETQWEIETADLAEDVLTECRTTGEPFIVSMEPEDVDAALNAAPGEDPPQPRSPFHTKHLTAYELWKAHERKRQLRKDYLDYWQNSSKIASTKRPIDALISPVAPFAATPHGKNNNANYTMTWNALDYPAIAFPVTYVDKSKDLKVVRTQFLGVEDKANYDIYDPTTTHGAPVGLQLVARTQEEEALLRMMEIVEKELLSGAVL